MSKEQTTLKPCPFCGGQADVMRAVYSGPTWWFVRCADCDVRFPSMDPGDRTDDENRAAAIRKWNRRPE